MSSFTAVFAIRSRFAERIYDRQKRFEFRRVRPLLAAGAQCFIYETAPTSLITGIFVVGEISRGSASTLAALESDLADSKFVEDYLQGAPLACAIEITSARRFEKPVSLSELGIRRPPQSYQYLEDELKTAWDTLRS